MLCPTLTVCALLVLLQMAQACGPPLHLTDSSGLDPIPDASQYDGQFEDPVEYVDVDPNEGVEQPDQVYDPYDDLMYESAEVDDRPSVEDDVSADTDSGQQQQSGSQEKKPNKNKCPDDVKALIKRFMEQEADDAVRAAELLQIKAADAYGGRYTAVIAKCPFAYRNYHMKHWCEVILDPYYITLWGGQPL